MPKGFRPQKEPTRKEMRQRMIEAEALAAERERELIRLNRNWGKKFDMIVQMMEALSETGIEAESEVAEAVTQLNELIDQVQIAPTLQQAAEKLRECKTLMEAINQLYLTHSLSTAHAFKNWVERVNEVDHKAHDAEQQMDDVIEEFGFSFEAQPVAVSHEDMCGRVVN